MLPDEARRLTSLRDVMRNARGERERTADCEGSEQRASSDFFLALNSLFSSGLRCAVKPPSVTETRLYIFGKSPSRLA